jgi:hypothetical protein
MNSSSSSSHGAPGLTLLLSAKATAGSWKLARVGMISYWKQQQQQQQKKVYRAS